jgi:hypothetical protein
MLLSMFKSRLESLQSFSSSDRIGISSCCRASCSSSCFSCFILASYACCCSLVRCFGIGPSSCLLFAYVCGAGGFFVPGLIKRPDMVQARRHLQPEKVLLSCSVVTVAHPLLLKTKGRTLRTASQNCGDARETAWQGKRIHRCTGCHRRHARCLAAEFNREQRQFGCCLDAVERLLPGWTTNAGCGGRVD